MSRLCLQLMCGIFKFLIFKCGVAQIFGDKGMCFSVTLVFVSSCTEGLTALKLE